jgi:sterol desaturase/sphingolipid hydroxylase (fatty acid hydroxylase superfamily)
VLVFLPTIAVLSMTGIERLGAAGAIALCLAGFLFWTLAEYWLHRVVFHFEPENGFGARMHWFIHGVHHDHPNDPMRLVMPPGASVPLALLFLAIFWGAMGYDAALAFGGGFLAGYLVYDMTHYHVHHHKPRTGFGRRLREVHMRHHFQDDDRGFGVSSPLWDYVFGTAPRRTGNRSLTGPETAQD